MDRLKVREKIRPYVYGLVIGLAITFVVIPSARYFVKESHEASSKNESRKYLMIEDDVMNYLIDHDYDYEMDEVDLIVSDILENKQYSYFEDIIIADENYLEKAVKYYIEDK